MPEVEDDPATSRFEMPGGDRVAPVEHTRAGDRFVLRHTEVPEASSGQGAGSKLVRCTLDAVRAEGSKAAPRRESAAAQVARRPEHRDLLDD